MRVGSSQELGIFHINNVMCNFMTSNKKVGSHAVIKDIGVNNVFWLGIFDSWQVGFSLGSKDGLWLGFLDSDEKISGLVWMIVPCWASKKALCLIVGSAQMVDHCWALKIALCLVEISVSSLVIKKDFWWKNWYKKLHREGRQQWRDLNNMLDDFG